MWINFTFTCLYYNRLKFTWFTIMKLFVNHFIAHSDAFCNVLINSFNSLEKVWMVVVSKIIQFWKYWLYVLIMSRTRFRVNPHSIVALNFKELLARNRREIWSLSDCNGTRTNNHLIRTRTLNHLAIWLNGWVFVYELNGCGFESRCSHLNFGNTVRTINLDILLTLLK